MTLTRLPDPGSIDHIRDVLRALVALLSEHDERDKAQWLATRLAVLDDGSSPEQSVRSALEELHGVVRGMGGLMDLYLTATAEQDAVHANAELRRLSDQLYQLTR